MSTTTVLTTDLQPGDEMVSRETWGTIYDLVDSVELPEPPAVVARVNIVRTRVIGHDVTSERTYFFSGIRGEHEVERACEHANPWPKTPSMSRGEFAYLARILAGLDFLADDGKRGGGTVHQYVAEHFAYHLADTNARFDRERFLVASGAGV